MIDYLSHEIESCVSEFVNKNRKNLLNLNSGRNKSIVISLVLFLSLFIVPIIMMNLELEVTLIQIIIVFLIFSPVIFIALIEPYYRKKDEENMKKLNSHFKNFKSYLLSLLYGNSFSVLSNDDKNFIDECFSDIFLKINYAESLNINGVILYYIDGDIKEVGDVRGIFYYDTKGDFKVTSDWLMLKKNLYIKLDSYFILDFEKDVLTSLKSDSIESELVGKIKYNYKKLNLLIEKLVQNGV